MLVKKPPEQTNLSPFISIYRGVESPAQQHHTSEPIPESNKGRGFRRAGNACEIIAGSCLNSAVIFTFHLLQVHPIGLFLAVGVGHFYFSATAAFEGSDRLLTNLMSGASASLALLCSLSEPIGEWWEASQSRSVATSEIQHLYTSTPSKNDISWLIIVLSLVLVLVGVLLARGRR